MADTMAHDIPRLGLGTAGRRGDEGLAALIKALELGYRHIDTAQSYGTEANVGKAVRAVGLARPEVFITTKVADTNLEERDFLPSVERSLEALGVEHVDLLLIHWPSEKDAVPFENYMLALAEAKKKGWAKRIGVSNYPIADLERAEKLLGAGALSTNQVELHPYYQSPRLCEYARKVGMPLTAYVPLAKGRVSADTTLAEIAERHGVTAAAVALAFLLHEGHIVIPASSNEQRLRDNMAALGVRLADAEVATIRGLDRGERVINPAKAPKWDD